MLVSHAKIVGKSQNNTMINYVSLLVLPANLVNIDDTSNLQDFLSLLQYIYTPFKRVSKVTELDVGKSQNKRGYH